MEKRWRRRERRIKSEAFSIRNMLFKWTHGRSHAIKMTHVTNLKTKEKKLWAFFGIRRQWVVFGFSRRLKEASKPIGEKPPFISHI